MAYERTASVIAAEELLSVISANHATDNFVLFLSEFERKETAMACNDAKSYMDWNFNFQEFYEILCGFELLPIEFLWNLHVFQVMPFEIYLSFLSTQPKLFAKFRENILGLCFLEDVKEEYASFVQSGVLSYIVRKAYPAGQIDDERNKLKKICMLLIKDILIGIYNLDDQNGKYKRLKPFFNLWNSGTIEEFSLYQFCLFALTQYLEVQTTSTDADVYLLFPSFHNRTAPFHLFDILQKIIAYLKSDELENILYPIIRKGDVNLESLLVVMSCVVMTNEVGYSMISKLIIGLMKEAFENFDKALLYRAILFGRQITLKDEVPISVSYGLWLQTFIGDCITLNNPKVFSFFISVMTDLIPLEKDIDVIKAALIHNLSVPFDCQSEYSEYMTLLKTRVKDLEPRIQPEKTIERVLSLFQETGKIPPFVLEASLVQKHQFLNEFLPALLTPRVKPQIPDTKENFIIALFQAGKIPNSLLQKYKLACKKEEDLLLADINMADNFIEFLDDDDDN